LCANPVYGLASGGGYSLSLSAGSWQVAGFYQVNGSQALFLGKPRIVNVPTNGTVSANLTIAYRRPAGLQGEIVVTGVPTGVQVQQFSVVLCPSYAPYTGIFPSTVCVNDSNTTTASADAGSFDITGLAPGTWYAYAGYCTEFGCEDNADAGQAVTLVGGHTRTANVTTPYIVPADGLLSATVNVTGAPSDFSDSTSLTACQVAVAGNCQTDYSYGSNTLPLILADGEWAVTPSYLASPFGNTVNGPTEDVDILGGATTTVTLDVPYQVPGTASGEIVVTGVPHRVSITTYTVIACPASSPMIDGQPSSACVSEYSGVGGYGYGPGISIVSNPARESARAPAEHTRAAQSPYNQYLLSGLTPGSWILYPGYDTAFGSYVEPVGTTVTVTAGLVTTEELTLPYQTPLTGLVTGTVSVIGAPGDGLSESGAQACSAPPTAISCPGEEVSFSEYNGAYQLPLPPGTWWVQGFVDLFGITELNQTQSLSPPVKVKVVAGNRITRDFTVDMATSSGASTGASGAPGRRVRGTHPRLKG
jgi:hypothetical protein